MLPDAQALEQPPERPALRSFGPDWDAAIAYGIDVSLLERNLALTVEERILQLDAMTQLRELLRPGDAPRDSEDA